jgi:diadenosine tetraphosphatase ApaH/serine/threonine PP2A family protein phosphatase
LADKAFDIMRQWPLSLRGPGFLCAHGDLARPGHFNYVFEPADAEPGWAATTEPLLFVGHAHVPALMVREADGSSGMVPPQAFTLEPGRRYLVNVGSVGQPRNGDLRASYCIYDHARQTVYFRRVPYDLEALHTAARQTGLPAHALEWARAHKETPVAREKLDFHPAIDESQAAKAPECVDVIALRKGVKRWQTITLITLLVAILLISGLATAWVSIRNRQKTIPPLIVSTMEPAPWATLPQCSTEPGNPLPGWTIRLGDHRRQQVSMQKKAGNYELLIESQAQTYPVELQSIAIPCHPGQRFLMQGVLLESKDFHGEVVMMVHAACEKKSSPTLLAYKSPGTRRNKDGSISMRNTLYAPQDGHSLTFTLRGAFTGSIRIPLCDLRPIFP